MKKENDILSIKRKKKKELEKLVQITSNDINTYQIDETMPKQLAEDLIKMSKDRLHVYNKELSQVNKEIDDILYP